jgi:hypothetical protein
MKFVTICYIFFTSCVVILFLLISKIPKDLVIIKSTNIFGFHFLKR